MNCRLSPYTVAAGITVLLSIALTAAGQPGGSPARTPDGQPDLQGIWTNPTITPFERPAELAGKSVLTEQEAAQLERRAAQARTDRPPAEGDVGNYNQFWFDSGTKVVATRQTSLVIDPPDGRVPVKPEAEARRDYNLAHNSDSYEYMSPWDRCITRGVPGAMFPAGYNNAYQIVQVPGYVVILSEMIHNARLHPAVGRRFARSLGRRHAGRGHDQLQWQRLDLDQRRRRPHQGDSAEPISARSRAVSARGSGYDSLPGDD